MRNLIEFFQRFSAHAVARRRWIVPLGMLRLELQQFGVHLVVFVIRNFGVVVHVVALGMVGDLLPQFFQGLFGFVHFAPRFSVRRVLCPLRGDVHLSLYQIFLLLSRGTRRFSAFLSIRFYKYFSVM